MLRNKIFSIAFGVLALTAPAYTQTMSGAGTELRSAQSTGIRISLARITNNGRGINIQLILTNTTKSRAYFALVNFGVDTNGATGSGVAAQIQSVTGITPCQLGVAQCPSSNLVNDYKKLTYVEPGEFIAITVHYWGNTPLSGSDDNFSFPVVMVARFAPPPSLDTLPGASDPQPGPARVIRVNFPLTPYVAGN